MSKCRLAVAFLMTSIVGCAEPSREPVSPATSSALPTVASPLGPQPTSPLPGAIAGFRFGMTPVEFVAHCKSVGTPNPLTGNDDEVRLHTCDAVEVEPGMRLNMFLGFCEGDSRLCEINYWTNRNAGKAFPILATKLGERFGPATTDNSTIEESSVEQCSKGDGKIRRTWWWGVPSDVKARVLLAFECKGGVAYVGVYFDDNLAAKAQMKRAKRVGEWPL